MHNVCLGLFLLAATAFAREWSVFVYMVADNDLAQWADSDLVELQEVGSTEDVAVVVQVDKPSVGARRLYILEGTVQEEQALGVIDMCDWSTLADFLEWGIAGFPADKYCLVLWDHGTGWTMMPQGTFGYDGSSGNRMSIANGDLRKALGTACDHAGEDIDLVAFDACLMQQVEIAFELREWASVMVGPQSVHPIAGFRYDVILDSLTMRPGMSAAGLGTVVDRTTVEQYANVQPIACSAVSIKQLETFSRDLRVLVHAVKDNPPNEALIGIRDLVQTIPLSGNPPAPGNAYVDCGDWLQRMDGILGTPESRAALDSYTSAVIDARYWGDDFSNVTGLSVWFPYTYPEFKQLLDSYLRLGWLRSSWATFLNWFYDSDDIRPIEVTLSASGPGGDNDFRLSWSPSFDLADVSFGVIECSHIDSFFYDPCEDTANWNLNGFSLSNVNVHSGDFSFFSGNAGNANNVMTTIQPINVGTYGLLTWFMWCNTEDMIDSLTLKFDTLQDVHYGRSGGWVERRVLVPPGRSLLSISYVTNASINNGGCYIDDIRMHRLYDCRYVRNSVSDTSLYIFNKEQGEYLYFVRPEDAYGNFGNVSHPVAVTIQQYALPYAIPNPFQTECTIVLDYPDSLSPSVEIFSLAGRFIRRYVGADIVHKTVVWDGKDAYGQEVGSGLYFILVKDGEFKRIGKIARQR